MGELMRMPAIFLGHGNPLNALADNDWTRAWRLLGETIPAPKAILCISAHWYIPHLAVTAMPLPRTIHDFGGFPPELFEFQYPAPGSPELAQRVSELLGGDVEMDTNNWGLDHGTWSVLCHLYPDHDIPVVQLSINETEAAPFHYEAARLLGPLRDEGVLVIGSGNLVHNLHAYAWGNRNIGPFDWAAQFDQTVRELITSGEHEPLIYYEQLGRESLLAVPTPEHYLPLLYILALQREEESVTFPVEGFDGGSISMTAVMVG